MLQAVTAYDKFRDVDRMTGVRHDNDYHYVINDELAIRDRKRYCDRWVAADNYWIEKREFLPALLSVLEKFRFSPETLETGLTYFSRVTSSVTMLKPEEEIELRVKMVPKATRNISLQINARSKGTPKPILL